MSARLIEAWGILGVAALLVQALWRLTPLALEAVRLGLSTGQWILLVVWVVVNAHAEGYRGFHRKFSPRAAARAVYLGRHRQPLHVAFAPLFCMALFYARPRTLKVAWGVFTGVLLLIVVIRLLPQPWRGIVDAGVVVGLGLGLASLLYHYGRLLAGAQPADPEVPELPEVPAAEPTPPAT